MSRGTFEIQKVHFQNKHWSHSLALNNAIVYVLFLNLSQCVKPRSPFKQKAGERANQIAVSHLHYVIS